MEKLLEELKDLPAPWLRDNCSCQDCRHQGNGQRLRSVLELPDDIEIIGISEEDRVITVEFSDGHLGTMKIEELVSMRNIPIDARASSSKILWNASDETVSPFNWAEYLDDTEVRRRALTHIQTHGYCIIRGVPTESGAVLEVIKSFGFVRATNYGELFNVRVKADPSNMAFTSLAIAPHTDNPYRNPVPTIQLLHCLETTVDGGLSGLVDGFLVAKKLLETDPKSFDLLSTTNFLFRYESATTVLESHSTIIELGAQGQVVGIRWNDRSISPPLNPENSERVFEAMRAFAKIANDSDLAIEFRLEPGDCVIFDNTRLLHSRTAYESSGRRHLQGAYADLDSLHSSLAILNRTTHDRI